MVRRVALGDAVVVAKEDLLAPPVVQEDLLVVPVAQEALLVALV